MRKAIGSVFVGLFALGFLLVSSDRSTAYLNYANTPDTWCAECHPGFQGKGALHDVHVNTFTNNCNLCHPSGPGSKPVRTFSAGDPTALSCLGCHGRDYGPDGIQAAGLRVHHANASPPVLICAGCHSTDPVPFAESTIPPHYGRGDVSLTSSCADNLDNDGNFDYDGADASCQVPVHETSWGQIKALYK